MDKLAISSDVCGLSWGDVWGMRIRLTLGRLLCFLEIDAGSRQDFCGTHFIWNFVLWNDTGNPGCNPIYMHLGSLEKSPLNEWCPWGNREFWMGSQHLRERAVGGALNPVQCLGTQCGPIDEGGLAQIFYCSWACKKHCIYPLWIIQSNRFYAYSC